MKSKGTPLSFVELNSYTLLWEGVDLSSHLRQISHLECALGVGATRLPFLGPSWCALPGGAALAINTWSSRAKILFLRSQMARARNVHDPGWILSKFKASIFWYLRSPTVFSHRIDFLWPISSLQKWGQPRKHQWMQMRKEKTSVKLIKRRLSFDLLFFCFFFSCVFCQGGGVSLLGGLHPFML